MVGGNIGHRISIYADDVVLFTTPSTQDLSLITTILQKFGEATGLHVNMLKSSILPIACDEECVVQVQHNMNCGIQKFPCHYLGLPLSIRCLTKTDLQPYIDKVVDSLSGWKSALMATSRRLILVRVVLTAMPLHLLIALDVAKWFIKAIDKGAYPVL